MSFLSGQDRRELAYGRLVFSTLNMLRQAVSMREKSGETRADIARRIGINRSQLSRTLNGRTGNMTLRTISDIVFSTGHTLEVFEAKPWESISQSWHREGPALPDVIAIIPDRASVKIDEVRINRNLADWVSIKYRNQVEIGVAQL